MLSALSIFFSFLSLYIYTLAPSVAPQGDSGELVTVAYTLGIAHPPGYPLFTLIAHLFTYLPFNSVAWRVNLFSAVCSAATLVFIYLIIEKITKSKLAGIGAAVILGLSQTFWLYSLVTEVFALNNLFVAMIIYLALEKRFLLLSFVLGLSLSNHHTIILIFPALAYLIFKNFPARGRGKFRFSYIFLFLLGLTPYIYFFIRAKTAVMPVAWSYPDTLLALFKLISRSDYGTFAPTTGTDPALVTLADKGQQLVKFFSYFLEDFWWPIIIPIILGLFVGLKKYFRFTIFLLLAFFLSGIFFLTYANFPIADQSGFGLVAVERFYLLPYLFLALLVGLGLSIFNKKINLILISFYVVMLLINNFGLVNQKNNFWGANLGKNILVGAPKNAVILVQGDTPVFTTFYERYVENFRPDTELLTSNEQGQYNQYRYLKLVRPELDFSAASISGIIANNYQKVSLVSLGPINLKVSGVIATPSGLLYFYSRDFNFTNWKKETENTLSKFNLPVKEEIARHYTLGDFSLLWYYPRMFSSLGGGCMDNGDYPCAINYFRRALDFDPDRLRIHYYLAGALEKNNDCQEAEKEYLKVYELNSQANFVFTNLLNLAKNCFKNEVKTKYYQEKMVEKQNAPNENLDQL